MSINNNEIKYIEIRVNLQLNPEFVVLADSNPDPNPGEAQFRCDGEGMKNAELFKRILEKIIESYPKKSINLCIDDDGNIVWHTNCRKNKETNLNSENDKSKN